MRFLVEEPAFRLESKSALHSEAGFQPATENQTLIA
jgi:hypothetical protein